MRQPKTDLTARNPRIAVPNQTGQVTDIKAACIGVHFPEANPTAVSSPGRFSLS